MRRTALLFVLAGLTGALVAAPIAVYASHQFNDVPDSHIFHNSIEWLADNGITVGCNPPANDEFCPEDNVTRGQMSAFLKRLSERQVVDAGQLEGYTVAQLAPRAAYDYVDDAPNGADLTLSAQLTAPAPGLIIAFGHVDVFSNQDEVYSCWLEVNDQIAPGSLSNSSLDGVSSVNNRESCSLSGTTAVAAGTHTIDYEVVNIDATTNVNSAAMWALWIPFDGTGATP